MSDMLNLLIVIIVVQAFFGIGITMVTYSMPEETLQYVKPFSEVSDRGDVDQLTGQLRESLTRQTNLPIVELGALVFYSGNIIIDMLLNFMFAIPQMLALLFNGFQLIFNINGHLWVYVEILASVIVSGAYLVGIIQLLTSIRSGVRP